MRRNRVVCADSVNFRCPGRRPESTPYIEPTAAPIVTAPKPAQVPLAGSNSDSSSEEEEEYDFIDVFSSSSGGIDSTYHQKVGLSFFDIDDDTMYRIDSVCRENKPNCRASFAILF